MKLVCFLALFVLYVNCAKKLPSFVEQCYRDDDKELSDCLLKNINLLKPRLSKGLPELLIPALDPLVIPSAVIANENNFRCDLKNVRLYHIDNMTITKLYMSFKSKTWDLEMEYPSLGIVTDYHMVGKLLVLEFNSMGENRGNMTGIKLKNNVVFDMGRKNGNEKIFIKSSSLKATISYSHMEFDNLFGGNKELSKQANQILNDNYRVFLDEFIPVIENIINNFVKNVLEGLYKKYPLDVLFPKKENN